LFLGNIELIKIKELRMSVIIKKVCSAVEIEQCLMIRHKVFVLGQQIPLEEEMDGQDENSIHYLLFLDNKPVGVTRVRFISDYAKIERVAILDEYQGQGLGRQLMDAILADLRTNSASVSAKLGAQTYALSFYEKLGFVAYTEEYMDAGIPHKDMCLIF
jgi:predicted GNAT family N-acyltransferase